jgi:hypothetical protein
MIYAGVVLYGLFILIVFSFWRRMQRLSFDDLLERSAHEHHDVQKVTAKHPRGGTWREHQQWMAQTKEKPRRRVRSKRNR